MPRGHRRTFVQPEIADKPIALWTLHDAVMLHPHPDMSHWSGVGSCPVKWLRFVTAILAPHAI
jgi:hypothetical protein